MISFKTHGNNGKLVIAGDLSRSSDSDRPSRIAAVVKDVLRRRHAGAQIGDAEIVEANLDLMPELGERLQTLGAIAAAARSASQADPREDSADPMHDSFTADLQYLNGALRGYTIIERVHIGGQGVVYKAIQRATQRVVAIKIMLDGPLASSRQRRRFDREIEIVAHLRHPHVITLFHSGTVRGRQFFAMEFVDGLPIHEHVLLHDMNTHDVVRLFVTVCRAVSYAHQNGIIHRDLKPANILVDLDGQPHVLDFGLAKDVTGGAAGRAPLFISEDGCVVGTLPYSSPEQIGGLDGRVDTRSDIYSLGVVLYQLLTECFPYPVDGQPRAVGNNIISRSALPLRQALRREETTAYPPAVGIDHDLETIVAKALAKEKERRYQSAAELADDLDRFLAGDAIVAKAASSLYVLKKTVRKHRVPAALVTAFVLIFTVGMTAMWQRAEGIAKIAQAKLSMGALLKDGSVRRDEGRLQQAISLLEGVLEIRDTVRANDPVIRRYEYGARHRLAELYFDMNLAKDAAPHCEAAVRLAEEIIRAEPHNPEWQRLLGFSYVLRGRMAASRSDWASGLSDFDKAASIREKLFVADPQNKALKAELAAARGWMGEYCMRLGRSTESRTHCEAAYELRRELFEAEPDVSDWVIGLTEALVNLASWHISQRLADADQVALNLLDRAEALLTNPANPRHLASRRGPASRLLSTVEHNKQGLRERAKRRASRLSSQSGS